MAQFTCDFSEQTEPHGANALITNLETGDTDRLCFAHMPSWAAAFLVASGWKVTPPGEETAPDAAGEAGAAPNPPSRKSGRRGRDNGETALSAPESPFPDAAPVDG